MHEARAEIARLLDWLRAAAWPRWLSHGIDRERGGFHEHLTLDGHGCTAAFRRLRVLTRQIVVFSAAHADGMAGAAEAVALGLRRLREDAARPDGGYAWRFDLSHAVTDDRRDLYDLAFTLLALASAVAVRPAAELRPEALALVAYVDREFPHQAGGFLESLPPALPRRQNPHMHLLEALLAAHEAFGDPVFLERADTLAALFADRLLDPSTGALPEYFNDALVPEREDGRFLVEPGHHCEWVWLLHRYRALRGGAAPLAADIETRLMQFVDAHAVVATTGAICDEVWSDGACRSAAQRLWPQTERLKAELLRADAQDARASQAARAMAAYLRPDGTWHERRGADGALSGEAAPASSLYHLTGAILTAADLLGLRTAVAARSA